MKPTVLSSSSPERKSASRVRLGAIEVDFEARELWKNGAAVRMPGQAFQILQRLVELNGEVVSREDLKAQLWPGDTFVDFAHSLNVMVARLRETLGDDAREPRYIQTLPKRGYRLLAPVVSVLPETHALAPNAAQTKPRTLAPLPARVLAMPRLAIGAVAVIALILIAVAIRHLRADKGEERIFSATNCRGSKDGPALSPDGRQLAFVWTGVNAPTSAYESDRPRHLYVKLTEKGEPIQLSHAAYDESFPAYSPDGLSIAFLRREERGFGVYIIPSLGGLERKVAESGSGGVAWSTDGKSLAFTSPPDAANRNRIVLRDLATNQQLAITKPESYSDSFPSISPDGKTLAFLRSYSLAAREVMTVPLAGGEPRQLTFEQAPAWGLAWTTTGEEIVYSAKHLGTNRLWRVPAGGGKPRRIAIADHDAVYPSIAREGSRLAYSEAYSDTNLYLRNLSTGEEHPISQSTRNDDSPQFSPDGQRVAFVSGRSGASEIYVSARDTTESTQLTHFNGPATGTPRWSPDGRLIAFDSRFHGHDGVYVVNVEGGEPQRLGGAESFEDRLPAFSKDGKWIYFCRQMGQSGQLFKRSLGGGNAVQLTFGGAEESFESPDGQLLYFVRNFGGIGIWTVPISGGEEKPVLELAHAGHWRYWGVVPGGLFFLPTAEKATRRAKMELFDFATRRMAPLAEIDNHLLWSGSGASLSVDRKWLAYVELDQAVNDLVVIDHFR